MISFSPEFQRTTLVLAVRGSVLRVCVASRADGIVIRRNQGVDGKRRELTIGMNLSARNSARSTTSLSTTCFSCVFVSANLVLTFSPVIRLYNPKTLSTSLSSHTKKTENSRIP